MPLNKEQLLEKKALLEKRRELLLKRSSLSPSVRSAEEMFKTTMEINARPSLDRSYNRQRFASARKKLDASTFLSERTGISVDKIRKNYPLYSGAHGFNGNHEADWEHMSGLLGKKGSLREQLGKNLENVPLNETLVGAWNRLNNNILKGAGASAKWISTAAWQMEQAFPKLASSRSFADYWNGENYEGRDVDDMFFAQLGKWIADKADELAPVDPRLRGKFMSDTLPGGVGDMIAFIIGGGVGKKVVKSGMASVTAMAVTSQGQRGFEEAIAEGATEDQQRAAFVVNSQIGGLEGIPLNRMLKALDVPFKGKILTRLKEAGISGLEEMLQESASTALGNAAAKSIYNSDREYWDGVIEGGAAGGVLGVLASFIISAVPGKQNAAFKKTGNVNIDLIPGEQESAMLLRYESEHSIKARGESIKEGLGQTYLDMVKGDPKARQEIEDTVSGKNIPDLEVIKANRAKMAEVVNDDLQRQAEEASREVPSSLPAQDTTTAPLKGIKAVPDADLAKFISEEDTALTSPLLDEAFGFTLGKAEPSNIVEANGKIEINGKEADPIPATDTTDTERALYKKEFELANDHFKTELLEDKSFTSAERDYFNALMEEQTSIELDEYGIERVKDKDLASLKKKAEESREGMLQVAKINKRVKDAVAKARLQGEIAVLKERAKGEELAFQQEEKVANLEESKQQAVKEVRFRATQRIKEIKKSFRDRITKIKEDARYKAAENKQAYLDERANTKEAIKQLRKLVTSLPSAAQSKFPASTYDKLAKAKTVESMQKTLDEATNRATEILDEHLAKVYRGILGTQIKRNVKRSKKAKEFEVFKEIDRIVNLSRLESENELEFLLDQDTLTIEEREKAFLHRIFGGKLNKKELLGFTADEMSAAILEANYIAREQKTSMRKRLSDQADKDQANIAEAQSATLGDQNPLSQNEIDKLKQDKGIVKSIFNSISSFDSRIQSYEWLLDKITNVGKQLKGPLQKYHHQIVEAGNRTFSGTNNKITSFEGFLSEVFNQAGIKKLANKISDYSEITSDTEVYIDGIEWTGSRSQAISMWMQWQDKSLSKTFDRMKIDQVTISEVEDFIKPEGIEIANKLLENYENYYDPINEAFVRNEGYSLSQVKRYSPISRETDPSPEKEGMDGFYSPTATAKNASLKSRTRNTNRLVFRDAFTTYSEHVAKMEHYIHHADVARDLRVVFDNAAVRRSIQQTSGNAAYKSLKRFNEDLINGGVAQSLVVRWLDKLRVNLTKSSLALKPAVFIKQLTSIPAYADAIPAAAFTKGVASFWRNPKKNLETLFTSEYLRERWSQGHERDVKDVLRGFQKSQIAHVTSLTDKAMILTRLGDVGAVVQGGWAVYKYNYKKGLSNGLSHEQAHSSAIKEFELTTKRSQQSSRLEDLSGYQRGNSWAKLFTMYMTAPASYYRLEIAAMRNLAKGRVTKAQAAKTIAIHHFILPNLFQAVSSGFAMLFTDDEEQWEELMWRQVRASVVGSFNGVLIAGGLIESSIDKMLGQQTWAESLPLLDFMDDIRTEVGGFFDSVEKDGLLEALDDGVKPFFNAYGIPYETVSDYFQGVAEVIKGETEHPILTLLGYSDYATAEDKDN